jgi:hypothetical protein
MSYDGVELNAFRCIADEAEQDLMLKRLRRVDLAEEQVPKDALRYVFGFGQTSPVDLDRVAKLLSPTWVMLPARSHERVHRIDPPQVPVLAAQIEDLRKSRRRFAAAINACLEMEEEALEERLRDLSNGDPRDAETEGERMAQVVRLLGKVLQRAAGSGQGVLVYHREQNVW